jgi:hypothetical protein
VTTAADVAFGSDPVAEILHLDDHAGPSATNHLAELDAWAGVTDGDPFW